MKQSKLPKQTLIILGIALVLVISTVMWSSAQITQDTEEEVQSTLRDVATQNALIVQQEIRENFNLLYSLADAISVSPGTANASSIAAQLESFVSTYGFKRIGFISRFFLNYPFLLLGLYENYSIIKVSIAITET